MVLQEGTYGVNPATPEYANSLEREERLKSVTLKIRDEASHSYQTAQEERRIARLGILELRRKRGLDTRSF